MKYVLVILIVIAYTNIWQYKAVIRIESKLKTVNIFDKVDLERIETNE